MNGSFRFEKRKFYLKKEKKNEKIIRTKKTKENLMRKEQKKKIENRKYLHLKNTKGLYENMKIQ